MSMPFPTWPGARWLQALYSFVGLQRQRLFLQRIARLAGNVGGQFDGSFKR